MDTAPLNALSAENLPLNRLNQETSGGLILCSLPLPRNAGGDLELRWQNAEIVSPAGARVAPRILAGES